MIAKIADIIESTPIWVIVVYSMILVIIFIYLIKIILDTAFFFNTIRGTWFLIKEALSQIKSIRGVVSFILAWLLLSGSGLIVLGSVLKNPNISGVGLTLMVVWMGPGTPLLPINFAAGMLIQRVVFFDRRVKPKEIINAFVDGFKGVNKRKEVSK